jgi:hypothetical protein
LEYSGKISVWNVVVSVITPVAVFDLRDFLTSQDTSHDVSTMAGMVVCWDDGGEHLICGTTRGEAFLFGVVVPHAAVSAEATVKMIEWLNSSMAK